MAVAVVHFRTPHAQLSQVFLCFPFCYNSNISPIYRGCPVDSGCPTPCDGHGVFSLSDNLHPIQLSVPMPFLVTSGLDLWSTHNADSDGHPNGVGLVRTYRERGGNRGGDPSRC